MDGWSNDLRFKKVLRQRLQIESRFLTSLLIAYKKRIVGWKYIAIGQAVIRLVSVRRRNKVGILLN
ncbi:unnamed protein product [Brassica napus]|uniref:(rape) hypothetical protein n=1 Tax=Brassica napus TaxID=3708 RepID=A0A816Y6Q7_BRANA|nr:unnamed protein product [Brassica napus]